MNLACLEDFTVSEGDEVGVEIILSDPNLSLYCFDNETRRAIFVELPPDVKLTTLAFIHSTQYSKAQRLVAVPYESFFKISETLPPVEHLIFIYMTGRSGSTLLSNVFNRHDTVMSLSEPDVITQFIQMRDDEHRRSVELQELLDCAVRILFKPNSYKNSKTYVLKGRAEMTRAINLFQDTFPHAKNLYLYRDAEGFVRSFRRINKNFGQPEHPPLSEMIEFFAKAFGHDLTTKTIYLEPGTEQISMIQWLTLWWVFIIEEYLSLTETGIPILPVRYTDLNESREEVLAAIFDHCNLPVDWVSQTLGAFEQDSQAGSGLQRENPREGNQLQLTDDERQEMLRILEQQPVANQSDIILPNTLMV
jgi:hypothetical protein